MWEQLNKRPFLKLSFLVLILFTWICQDTYKDSRGREHYFLEDVDQYYSYLPAYFIHDDLEFKFDHGYWLMPAANGKKVPKVTMGLALMNTPFFLMGDLWAKHSTYSRDGYSYPYVLCIRVGALFYFLLGMLFLAKALLKFFDELTAIVSCALVFLGTNLLYYALGHTEMPHSYLFMLFAVIIYQSLRWHESGKIKPLLIASFLSGLAVLVRPTAGLILLVPLMYGITSISLLKEKLNFFWHQKWRILISLVMFFLPLVPQLLFWKIQTGNYFFFSYGGDERFFFTSPHILEFLFSYRKGWLLYTPMMALALAGLVFLRGKAKELSLLVPFIIVIAIYVFSSWWSWWYGGSFGMRSMVHYYPILAFPLAALISACFKKTTMAIAVTVICALLVSLNMSQAIQYKRNMIHWDGMTKEAYWFSIEHPRFEEEHWPIFESYIDRPDYDAAKKRQQIKRQ